MFFKTYVDNETVWPWPPCSIEVHEATQIGQLGLQEAAGHQINYQSHI